MSKPFYLAGFYFVLYDEKENVIYIDNLDELAEFFHSSKYDITRRLLQAEKRKKKTLYKDGEKYEVFRYRGEE